MSEAKSRTERKKDEEKAIRKKRINLIVGILAAGLLVFLGGYLVYLLSSHKTLDDTPKDVAILDMERVYKGHPAYEKLRLLSDEKDLLEKEIKNFLPAPINVTPPKAEEKPFEESALQKNAQNVISERAEIEEAKKKAALAYREQTQEEYNKKKNTINNVYLNELLNIRLKLSNADVMRLSPETVAELLKRQEELQIERGKLQAELDRAREEDIRDHGEEAVRERLEKWRTDAKNSRAALEAEAEKKQAEATNRNVAAMEKQVDVLSRYHRLAEKQGELARKEMEIATLKNRIENDIISLAAKLSIMHRFTLVLTKPSPVEDALGFTFKFLPARDFNDGLNALYVKDAPDITDNLLSEYKYMDK